jgi:hypothetical protein
MAAEIGFNFHTLLSFWLNFLDQQTIVGSGNQQALLVSDNQGAGCLLTVFMNNFRRK